MTDIFDATILCKKCNTQMKKTFVNKLGFNLRAVVCESCADQIVHPNDVRELEAFRGLKGKTYNVKLRVVGNSHAISIPKEIVNFIRQQEQMIDNMVELCFEDMRCLTLRFGDEERRNA